MDVNEHLDGHPPELSQITDRADLNRMTPSEVDAARKAGRLDTLMGKTPPPVDAPPDAA
ncbi:hypothetical protein GCM10022222_57050 [Amycolatopsis ultiminotia]|uniref:Uncharacterized protein n=1 Tax=Amycolatopsis ultiminotia TaxID=543629 RepID=A0ABP6XG68_9PSEU